MLTHVLPDLVLTAVALGVAWLLVRRPHRWSFPALLAVSGTGILVIGSLVEATMWAAGLHPDPAGPGSALTRAVWHTAGMALLAAGVGWSALRRVSNGGPSDGRPPERCPADALGCAACRDEDLAQVCALTADGTIVAATRAFAQAVGREPADLEGRALHTVLDLPGVTTDKRRVTSEGIDRTEVDADELDGGSVSSPGTLRTAGGASRPILASVQTHASRRGEILSIAIHDASALISAECRARDAEALQRGIAELDPLGVLIVGREGIIRQANSAASRLLGLPRQSVEGHAVTAVIERVVADRVDAERFISRAWHDKAGALSLQVRRPGHRPYPVELLAHTFWELPEAVLLIFARGKAYERRLERQLAGTHRLSVLGKLFTGTAHDLNNVLATILASSQWLQRVPSVAAGSRVRESLALMEQAAADGAHMIHRALDLARGRRRDRMHVVALNRVVADALAMCRSRTHRSSVPICVEQRLAQSSTVRGDSCELRELLINLILNAVEAMPHGGTLRVATQADADHVRLSVTDTGQGMDGAVRHRMFEPFFTTKGYQGSGLGLTLVRQIAARHQATLEVESEPGRGTTVEVTLARAHGEPRERPAAPLALGARPQQTGRVLMVDDEEGIRRVVQDILTQAGHQVRTAGGARQALAACSRREFDCVLIDLHMPGVDGWQLASQARHLDPAAALIMLSGWVDTSETARGPFDFSLAKPFELDHLLHVVSAAVALSASRRAPAADAQSPVRTGP